LVKCPSCEIGLPDGTVRCPSCQRNLLLPMWGLIVGVVAVCGILGAFLYLSGRLKNRVEGSLSTPAAAYSAARDAVSKNPAIHDLVKFSGEQETTIERWDRYRYRVSGYVDMQPKTGSRVRTLFFCVMRFSGEKWDVEDMQLQSMEFPGGSTRN